MRQTNWQTKLNQSVVVPDILLRFSLLFAPTVVNGNYRCVSEL